MDRDKFRRKVYKKLKKEFNRTPKNIWTVKISEDTRLVIDYMYGGAWCIHKKTKGKRPVLVEMLADSNTVADIILEHKQIAKNPILSKLKQLIK